MVHQSIESNLAAMLAEMDEQYEKATRPNGTVIVQLDKCLYGCIESARKWQMNVMKTMEENDMEPNAYDPCFGPMNRTCRAGAQLTIAVYVDDILMTSTNEEEMEEVLHAFKNRYGDVKSHRGDIIEFLGKYLCMIRAKCWISSFVRLL